MREFYVYKIVSGNKTMAYIFEYLGVFNAPRRSRSHSVDGLVKLLARECALFPDRSAGSIIFLFRPPPDRTGRSSNLTKDEKQKFAEFVPNKLPKQTTSICVLA
jgi:hypothetical protein